ncbi:MAG: NrfD/PsrC family molybdoenzyme membrane anchor subunit [Halodesulfurarchaeum sp.]
MSATGGAEWLWLPHVHWGVFIATYLFLGGVAGGAFLTSSWASFMHSLLGTDRYVAKLLLGETQDPDHEFACCETSRWGAIIALLAIGVGSIALLTHLGAPLRALTFAWNFTNYGSWMVIGTWLIILFSVVTLLEALWLHFGREVQCEDGLSLFPRRILRRIDRLMPWQSDRGILRIFDLIADITRIPGVARGAFRVVGSALAVLVVVYTAMLLSDLASVPLWSRTYLPFIFLMSGVSTGISAALLGTVMSGGALSRVNHRFCLTDDAIIIVELVAIGALLSFLAESANVGAQATLAEFLGTFQLEFVGGVLIVGTSVPVVISLTVTVLHKFTEFGESAFGRRALTYGYATKYVLVLVGGYLLRYVVLLAAVKTPLAVPGL